jgi:RNA polymerase sporulation-specific sigma factor
MYVVDRDRLFTENIPLAYFIAQKWRLNYADIITDIEQEAQIGLWKACRSFDPGRGIKFSTYAARCIENQLGMFHRGQKKHRNRDVSLSQPLVSDYEGNELTYEDILAAKDIDLDLVVVMEEVMAATDKTLAEKLFLLYYHEEMSQRDLADILGYSQSYVSRLIHRGARRLRQRLEGVYVSRKKKRA